MSDATPEDSQGPFDFVAAVEAGKADVLEACVACGKCFEVCPTVANAGLAEANPESTSAAVLDILTGGQGTEAAVTFANTCMGSGFCIDACDYGVNPRFMLTLARRELDRRDDRERRRAGVAGFRKVAEGARTLSRLVATEAERARLSGRTGPADGSPEVVFYTGCNVWKTPHIVMLCLDVLDRLGTRTAVMGGPDHCCGVLHWRAGDTATAGRFAGASIDRFSDAGAERVLAWCPTCQVQFSEINLPAHARVDAGRDLAMKPFLPWLAARLDSLAPHFVHPVRRRVGLHERPGVGGVTEAALEILDAIPVSSPSASPSSGCSASRSASSAIHATSQVTMSKLDCGRSSFSRISRRSRSIDMARTSICTPKCISNCCFTFCIARKAGSPNCRTASSSCRA